MTNRWRLVNQNQLYDINADPAQKNNVAADHPQVVKRLRDFYEAWWEELEPTFSRDCPIYLGDPAENPATLTSHDWLAPRMTPWNQSAIRKGMARPDATGPWKVKVVASGQYEIRLRRWPRETGAALDAALPPASDVPGARAYRTEPGKPLRIVRASLTINGKTTEKKVTPGSQDALFELRLEEGVSNLKAMFHTADGQKLGAYYAYVTRISQ